MRTPSFDHWLIQVLLDLGSTTLELVLTEEDWLNLSNLNLMVALKVVEVVVVDLSLKRLTVASIEAH